MGVSEKSAGPLEQPDHDRWPSLQFTYSAVKWVPSEELTERFGQRAWFLYR